MQNAGNAKDMEVLYRIGVCSGIAQADRAAERMAHDVHGFGAEIVDEVREHLDVAVRAVEMTPARGVAKAGEIERQDMVIVAQYLDQRLPGRRPLAVDPMHQHDRGIGRIAHLVGVDMAAEYRVVDKARVHARQHRQFFIAGG